MASLSKLIQILHGQLGYRESGTNHQKYSPAVPGLEWSQNQPWCATYNSWAYLKAGLRPHQDFPVTASCLAGVSWYRSHGRWSGTPRVGAQVFYGPGGGTHVEIVVAVSGSTITTIGGNTGGSLGGSYFNGDGVYKKVISRNESRIYGYGLPFNLDNSNEEDDTDMPNLYVSLGSTRKERLGEGEWCNLGWDREWADGQHQHGGPGAYPTVLTARSKYNATVVVAIDGMGPKDAGWVRAAEAQKGKNGFFYPEFSATDTVRGRADGGTIWHTMTWNDFLGKDRRLRIQAGSFTCPVTVTPYSVKIHGWKV